MPRQPRLDAPGVVHHVMVRGIERRTIFLDDFDRAQFRDRLCEVIPDAGARVLASALMPNHVHLVVRSGQTPLSRLMSRLNTSYAVRFNRRHERAGYLFQNRFKSLLVTDDDHLRRLLRYVHLNPLRGGLVGDLAALEQYPWSSHGALMGTRPALAFEDPAGALALFGDDLRRARLRLRTWMEEDLSGVPSDSLEGEFEAERGPATVEPLSHRGAELEQLDLARLIQTVCRHFSTTEEEIRRGARHTRASNARAVICHVAVVRWRLPGGQVARAVGVSSAAVSQALARGGELGRLEIDLGALPARDFS